MADTTTDAPIQAVQVEALVSASCPTSRRLFPLTPANLVCDCR